MTHGFLCMQVHQDLTGMSHASASAGNWSKSQCQNGRPSHPGGLSPLPSTACCWLQGTCLSPAVLSKGGEALQSLMSTAGTLSLCSLHMTLVELVLQLCLCEASLLYKMACAICNASVSHGEQQSTNFMHLHVSIQ